jgi:hypothetical protein
MTVESEIGMPKLTDGLVFGFPKELRRCRQGHSWYSIGKFYVAHRVFTTGDPTSVTTKEIASEDLCPYCLMVVLNNLCGGVEVVTEATKSSEET